MNEVVKQNNAMVSNVWGAAQGMDAQDLLLPKILLGQATSDPVQEGKVGHGDLYDSLTHAVLAKNDRQNAANTQDLEVIIFRMSKQWLRMQLTQQNEWELHSMEDYTVENCRRNIEERLQDGTIIKNYKCIYYYAFTVEQLAQDGESAMPYVIPFKSTSLSTAKTIGVYITKLSMQGKPSAAKVFVLGRKKKIYEKKNSTYWVTTATQGRDTTEKEMKVAKRWFDLIHKGEINIEVDQSEYAKDDRAVTPGPGDGPPPPPVQPTDGFVEEELPF